MSGGAAADAPPHAHMYEVRPGLHAALANGRYVFLDVPSDRYFCVSGSLEEEFGRVAQGLPPTRQAEERLNAAGLAARAVPVAGVAPAQESLLDRPCGHGTARDCLAIAWALARTVWDERWTPFARRLAQVRRPAHGASIASPDEARRRAQAFLAIRPLLPFARDCLRDSLALMRFLGPAAPAATLVIGVKMDPFAAHCWIQIGSMVANDVLDHASSFTPILAV